MKTNEPTSIDEFLQKHNHYILTPSEDPYKELEELYEYASTFYDEHCTIQIEMPGNEKRKGYSEEELGFEIVAMPKKSTKKGSEADNQTGDYAVLLRVADRIIRLKIRFERKSVVDFCGTVINDWKRFWDELQRAKSNPEIEDFRIVVEGDLLQTLTFFFPYPKVCKYCEKVGYKLNNKKRTYYCRTSGKPVNYNSNCGSLRLKKRSAKQIAQLIAFKRKRIGMIEAMGFPIEWCGSRSEAATYINVSIKEYFIIHYAEILGFEKYTKLVGEDRESLTFEISGMKFIVPKDAIKVIA